MIRLDSFGRSVAFSALAALAYMPWVVISAPLVGVWTAHALYLVGSLVLYVACLGERLRVGVVAAASVAAFGCALSVGTLGELGLALAALLGAFRSGIVFGPAGPRSIAYEVGLLAGGLLFARFLGGSGIVGTAISLWGFFLIQSLYFLRGDAAALVGPGVVDSDGFETACRRAGELLDRD